MAFQKFLMTLVWWAISHSTYLLFAQTMSTKNKMDWFGDAKLGIFIHWGIYAVNGIDESWSFYNGYVSHADYLKQTNGFTAANYYPESWVNLIEASGAKYTIITSRHHDGFSLWDTHFGSLNAKNQSAAKRDVLTPFVKAVKRSKLKLGLYYSLPDWTHSDYPNFTSKENRYKNDPIRWQRFLSYLNGQLDELNKNYHPDLWWFDGDWEFADTIWQAREIRSKLLQHNPDVIINSRLQGYGDYATPEQGLPVKKPVQPYWELCMTMNDSWGYQGNDQAYKAPQQIIQIFSEVIGQGGNLLLDIGPKADGSIPTEQIQILTTLGEWTQKHAEAIYGSKAGLPAGYFHGPSTLSADSTILYLFLPQTPSGQIYLRGVKNKINRIRVVGEGTKLSWKEFLKPYWSNHAGMYYIDIPKYVADKYMTVIAIQLNGSLQLE